MLVGASLIGVAAGPETPRREASSSIVGGTNVASGVGSTIGGGTRPRCQRRLVLGRGGGGAEGEFSSGSS